MNTPSTAGSPTSLLTATPADGQRLARQLAEGFLTDLSVAKTDMPAMLRTPVGRPAPDVAAAIYFHAIALANGGWSGTPRSPG